MALDGLERRRGYFRRRIEIVQDLELLQHFPSGTRCSDFEVAPEQVFQKGCKILLAFEVVSCRRLAGWHLPVVVEKNSLRPCEPLRVLA